MHQATFYIWKHVGPRREVVNLRELPMRDPDHAREWLVRQLWARVQLDPARYSGSFHLPSYPNQNTRFGFLATIE